MTLLSLTSESVSKEEPYGYLQCVDVKIEFIANVQRSNTSTLVSFSNQNHSNAGVLQLIN